ncbi:drug resistance transporter, EmrB/QacA subfamily [Paenibacillus sophorae]|uniref:DHA2 family efflux MFS transporter permease subunit n=1 Tax=Paenibacillus sophorae TaxID=1333845 RepID=A0A1H8U779_9BACL|nr:DHA2 family efflux MFS transporter permease subunit [Paenibacillus sophorae]QWU17986.1 DHA2 family efflux MFS transporter permease subunit [Paenibacillus sophorae]SEO99130.1 drug resistance transporter, EmrB/QacA subfamily [Paenibacillus sophorae]
MAHSEKSKWWVLFSLTFGLLAVGLDMTVLNVALPTLATDMQASTSQLQWILDSYNLVLAAMLLPAGMLGDRYGRKKLLLLSLVVFGGASAACAFSSTPAMLIGMRALLGLGAAFLIPLSMSVLPVLFTEAERTKAMMIWAMANMLGIPLGPILGGWLLNHYSWGSVFLINLPLIAIALVAVGLLMPESRSEKRLRLDIPGILSSSLGLTCVTYGVIRAGEHGWGDKGALGALLAGLLIVAGFLIWQRRTQHPLIDLSLFRSSSFTWGTILATSVSFAMFGLLFVMPQYFQAVNGADALGTGLRLLPMIGGLLIGAKIADAIINRLGAKYIASLGFAIMAGSLILGTATSLDSSYAFAALWISIAGLGLGFALPTAMDLAISKLSAERSGVGSALVMAMRQVGGAIGVALLGAALNSVYRGKLVLGNLSGEVANTVKQSVSAGVAVADRLGSPEMLAMIRSAFVQGMDQMLWICGGIALVSSLLALLFLPSRTAVKEMTELNSTRS